MAHKKTIVATVSGLGGYHSYESEALEIQPYFSISGNVVVGPADALGRRVEIHLTERSARMVVEALTRQLELYGKKEG